MWRWSKALQQLSFRAARGSREIALWRQECRFYSRAANNSTSSALVEVKMKVPAHIIMRQFEFIFCTIFRNPDKPGGNALFSIYVLYYKVIIIGTVLSVTSHHHCHALHMWRSRIASPEYTIEAILHFVVSVEVWATAANVPPGTSVAFGTVLRPIVIHVLIIRAKAPAIVSPNWVMSCIMITMIYMWIVTLNITWTMIYYWRR